MTRFALALFTLVFWASTVIAGPDDAFGKALIARIKSDGFHVDSIRTTWLRRIQIDSTNRRNRRQTVYNPVTAVLLQDIIVPIGEEGFLEHVSEILGLDLRSGRTGRSGAKDGKGTSGKPKGSNGKSGGKPENGKTNNGKANQ